MKQIAQNYKSGDISLLDVPVPACKAGGVLVRSDFSLISMGTESMKIHESKLSLIGKARARPDQVKKVMETMAQQGPVATYKKVMNRLDSYTPLGYSLSGVVVQVGAGVDDAFDRARPAFVQVPAPSCTRPRAPRSGGGSSRSREKPYVQSMT